MRDAVIVAAARTPIGRAYKGAFNATAGATLGALSLEAAVARAGIEPEQVEQVVMGCAGQFGADAYVSRVAAVNAGLPTDSRLPLAAVGVILGIDRILDMCRTTVNVWGDAVGAAVVARYEEEDPVSAGPPAAPEAGQAA